MIEKTNMKLESNTNLMSFEPPTNPTSKKLHSSVGKSCNRFKIDKIKFRVLSSKKLINELIEADPDKKLHKLSLVENFS